MTPIAYFGADPGASGAVAILSPHTGYPEFVRLDDTTADVLYQLRSYLEPYTSVGVLEQVNAMPGQGVSSSFKFGQSFGQLEAMLLAIGARFERVRPAVWQKALGCLTKGDKNVSKRKAQELFPGLTITHRTADALLLAEYARRYMK